MLTSLATPTHDSAPVSMQDALMGGWPEDALVLSDLDGCLVSGDTVLPGVTDLVRRSGDRLWVVSNNSSDTAWTLSDRLARLGLKIPAARILLAGEEALRRLAVAHVGARTAIFAAAPLVALARDLGLVVTRGGPGTEVAFLARDPHFHMSDLERLMRLMHAGTPLWLANPDPYHPAADGAPVPETGALFAALVAANPDLRAVCHAKPSPSMIETALARSGSVAAQAVFLGDTDATDGAAARAAGVPFILLRRPAQADRSVTP